MPRLSRDELGLIIVNGLSAVGGISMDDDALLRITLLSQVLPHYTHLLALTSAQTAIEHGRTDIRLADVHEGLDDVLELRQEGVRNAYYQATVRPRKENLFKQVLLACAMAEADELGYFAPAEVRGPMSRFMETRFEIVRFAKHLRQLCQDHRGRVLHSRGAERKQRYRFRNPLLQPYILLPGQREGLLTEDSVSSGPEPPAQANS